MAFDDAVAGQLTDDQGYDHLFNRYRRRLVGICAGFVGGDDAEDIVHDAYERGRRGFKQLRDVHTFDAWITRIAINLCRDHRRRAGLARSRMPDLVQAARQRSKVTGPDLGLQELIERLDSKHRTVLVLHYGHGYSLLEIADLLDMNHNTVKSIAARSRRRLAVEWLKGHDR